MKKENLLRENIEKSRLLVKLSIISAIGSIFVSLLLFFSGSVFEWAGSDVYSLSLIPYVMASLFSFSALIYGAMAVGAGREEEEKALLARRKDSSLVLNTEEDARFTAQRSFENYKKYAPYFLAALSAAIIFSLIFVFWHYWDKRVDKVLPTNTRQAAFVGFVLMVISVMAGAFCIGQSREKSFRWLRPVGAWLIMGFVMMLCSTAASLFQYFGIPEVEKPMAKVLICAFALLGAEFIINFVMEFYRPRSLEEPRPVFESRLLALFTEPGGVARNIADTLDYQFGFNVSRTRIYSFIEKALFPFLLIWVVVLWAFTSINEVGPTEIGVHERFGKIVDHKILPSGIYFTLPYPFGRIARFSPNEIHQVVIGPEMKDDKGVEKTPETIVWTQQHYAKEARFVVASEKIDTSSNPATSISFLGASLPVQYRIRQDGIFDYAYRNADPEGMLKAIGRQVIGKYFASCPMLDVMSSKREQVMKDLQKLIQQAVDAKSLGIDIVCVNLHDAHPPVEKVAPAFQNVIGAMEEKEAQILKAKSYREKILPEAQSMAARSIAEAQSYSYSVEKVSEAEAERFNKQLQAYNTMPGMFKLNAYLDLLEKDCKSTRKFIMSASTPYEIYELNFEQKARLDLLDADLGSVQGK